MTSEEFDPLAAITERAARAGKTIALSEGADPRIIEAALAATGSGLARVILVGNEAEVKTGLARQNGAVSDKLQIMDPATAPQRAEFAEALYRLRQHKGVSPEAAARFMLDPLVFAAMTVRLGLADGTVGGAVATTADVVRAAIQVIGKAPDAALVSSFFLMVMDQPHHDPKRAVLFADSGLVVEPDAEGVAHIALSSAVSLRQLLGDTPHVALLSFSTKGSASHARVRKMTEALELAQAMAPDLSIDGELQFDAAFVPGVAKTKAPGSPVAGQANVFVFPDLDAGNIGYKIAQRVGGATAIGPIMQGLAKPANDLSRGCTASDVLAMIAVTAVQAQK